MALKQTFNSQNMCDCDEYMSFISHSCILCLCDEEQIYFLHKIQHDFLIFITRNLKFHTQEGLSCSKGTDTDTIMMTKE